MLAKVKLNNIQVLISNQVVSHDVFVLINNVLKEYEEMKKEIKNSNKKWVCLRCNKRNISIRKTVSWNSL